MYNITYKTVTKETACALYFLPMMSYGSNVFVIFLAKIGGYFVEIVYLCMLITI